MSVRPVQEEATDPTPAYALEPLLQREGLTLNQQRVVLGEAVCSGGSSARL